MIIAVIQSYAIIAGASLNCLLKAEKISKAEKSLAGNLDIIRRGASKSNISKFNSFNTFNTRVLLVLRFWKVLSWNDLGKNKRMKRDKPNLYRIRDEKIRNTKWSEGDGIEWRICRMNSRA